MWKGHLEKFEEMKVQEFRNPNGRERSDAENKMIMLVVMEVIRSKLESDEWSSISWTYVDKEVARILMVDKVHVSILRKFCYDEGELPDIKTGTRGRGSSAFNKESMFSINESQVKALASHVDSTHAKGETCTNKKLRVFMKDEHGLEVSRTTMQRTMKRLGLSWRKVKPKARTFGAYRNEAIRDYLIDLDKYTREIANGNEKGLVFVFMDESYVHDNHAAAYSFTNNNQRINRTNSRGNEGYSATVKRGMVWQQQQICRRP